jgi:hypothetical protein
MGVLRNCAAVWCTPLPRSKLDFRAWVDAAPPRDSEPGGVFLHGGRGAPRTTTEELEEYNSRPPYPQFTPGFTPQGSISVNDIGLDVLGVPRADSASSGRRGGGAAAGAAGAGAAGPRRPAQLAQEPGPDALYQASLESARARVAARESPRPGSPRASPAATGSGGGSDDAALLPQPVAVQQLPSGEQQYVYLEPTLVQQPVVVVPTVQQQQQQL